MHALQANGEWAEHTRRNAVSAERRTFRQQCHFGSFSFFFFCFSFALSRVHCASVSLSLLIPWLTLIQYKCSAWKFVRRISFICHLSKANKWQTTRRKMTPKKNVGENFIWLLDSTNENLQRCALAHSHSIRCIRALCNSVFEEGNGEDGARKKYC